MGRTKPTKVHIGWKYRNEPPGAWREVTTVDLDYETDANAVTDGVQNSLTLAGIPFDPANEIIDVFADPESGEGKRLGVRLLDATQTTTLDTGVDATETSWTVDDPAVSTYFAAGDFFRIGSEVCQVTAIVDAGGGNDTWTVRRGEHGTTAASHLAAATIRLVQFSTEPGYQEVTLSALPDADVPGAPQRLYVFQIDDGLGNGFNVQMWPPTTNTRTLTAFEIQFRDSVDGNWASPDTNLDSLNIRGVQASGSDGTVSQGGNTLTTTVTLNAAWNNRLIYVHEGLDLTTGEVDFPEVFAISSLVDNGDGTWTVTLPGDQVFTPSFSGSGDVNFIIFDNWAQPPTTDLELWIAEEFGANWTLPESPERAVVKRTIRSAKTLYVRGRWVNKRGGGQWMYWDGTSGDTDRNNASTEVPLALTVEAAGNSLSDFALNISMTATDNDTVSWSAGSVQFSNGNSESINTTGSPQTLTPVGVWYVYKLLGNATLQFTQTFTTAVGTDRILLGQIISHADASEFATIMLRGDTSGPTVGIDSLAVNELSAIVANLGSINAGDIVGVTITTSSGGVIRTSASGTRVQLSSSDDIEFYDATTQVASITEGGSNLNISADNSIALFPAGLVGAAGVADGTYFFGNIYAGATNVELQDSIDMNANDLIDVNAIEVDIIRDATGGTRVEIEDDFDFNDNNIIDAGDVECNSLTGADAGNITTNDHLEPAGTTQFVGINTNPYRQIHMNYIGIHEVGNPGTPSANAAWVYLDSATNNLVVEFDTGNQVVLATYT